MRSMNLYHPSNDRNQPCLLVCSLVDIETQVTWIIARQISRWLLRQIETSSRIQQRLDAGRVLNLHRVRESPHAERYAGTCQWSLVRPIIRSNQASGKKSLQLYTCGSMMARNPPIYSGLGSSHKFMSAAD